MNYSLRKKSKIFLKKGIAFFIKCVTIISVSAKEVCQMLTIQDVLTLHDKGYDAVIEHGDVVALVKR